MAAPFILKSLSVETRESYRRGINEFFRHAGWPHPVQVTQEHVLRYRDRLIRDRRRPATVAQKLSVVRSFFSYLQAAGVVTLNPASTKLVPPPPVPAQHAGRALTPKEVRHLLASPDKTKPEGARDYAMLLVMLRLSLRLSEVCSLRRSSITASQGRWILRCKVKGGREEVWPLLTDVKEAIDDYLRLDNKRRRALHSDGPDAPLFQPHSNYRTLVFDKALSPRQVQRIVEKWGKFSDVGKVTPHDLRRTVVTELLNRGHSYREVQMVTKHRDPKTVMRYDHSRENLESNPLGASAQTGTKQQGGAAGLVAAVVQVATGDLVKNNEVDVTVIRLDRSLNNLKALNNVLNNSPVLSKNNVEITVQNIQALNDNTVLTDFL